MSRIALATALLACLGGAAFAADAGDVPAPKAERAKAAAVNTIDPISGAAVDAAIKAVTVRHDGHEVVIGVSSAENAETIRKSDKTAKSLYAQAALAGKLVKDGKLIDAPKAEAAK